MGTCCTKGERKAGRSPTKGPGRPGKAFGETVLDPLPASPASHNYHPDRAISPLGPSDDSDDLLSEEEGGDSSWTLKGFESEDDHAIAHDAGAVAEFAEAIQEKDQKKARKFKGDPNSYIYHTQEPVEALMGESFTALALAASLGDAGMCRLLVLQMGADVGKPTRYFQHCESKPLRTPTEIAAQRGHQEALRVLVTELGASPQIHLGNALYYPELIRPIVSMGADPNLPRRRYRGTQGAGVEVHPNSQGGRHALLAEWHFWDPRNLLELATAGWEAGREVDFAVGQGLRREVNAAWLELRSLP